MSSDGPGNFDSDEAYDTLGFLIEELVNRIKLAFTYDSSNSLYNSSGDREIMANIDIILTLCTHYEAYPLGIYNTEEIRAWKNHYLDTFDRTIHLYDPSPGYAENRRKVIAETFDKLEKYLDDILNDV